MSFTPIELKKLESEIGLFSKQYKTNNVKGHAGLAQDIAFDYKPAQQFLKQLGGHSKDPLSVGLSNEELKKPILIKSFSPKDNPAELEIAAACVKKLLDSAKLYINTSLFPAGLYEKLITKETNTPEKTPSTNELYNLAVGVCHAQIIYPLTRAIKNNHGRSISTPYSSTIKENNPGILLLSCPRLNFKEGYTDLLSEEQQIEYIESMYRNLFQATLSEGRYFLAMPAAGLGKSGGSPELYFSSLMNVAREFPELTLIYHPSSHEKAFNTALGKAQLSNVLVAKKDIIVITERLTQQGKPCALHVPCSNDVIYGHCDVGGLWKKEKNKQFTLQEYIGSMTTAPLNSYGFNPKAYQTLIERPLHAPKQALPQPTVPEPKPTAPIINEIIIPTQQEVPVIPPTPHAKPLPTIPNTTPRGSNPHGLFQPESKKQSQTVLTQEDLSEINGLIDTLQSEISSCWPYPNKDLKQEKIDALNLLKIKTETMSVIEAVNEIKNQFSRVAQGFFSTRTSDLLNRLAQKENKGLHVIS